ncbi:MAG TPA: retropepsin-like aspartic protease [Thermoanaerobaculia bacterium]|nr:retropepsin-like aspartic protease [Thermoanaerobaculia bacterium]
MPSFTFSFADLVSSGPTLPIRIGPSRAFAEAVGEFGTAAAPITAVAMVDTGAQQTVLSPDVAAQLGLKAVGAVPVITPTTTEPVQCDLFHVNVYFSPEVVVENVLAAQAPLIGHGFQCLIGRDVLQKGVLVYIGNENQFTLTF